MKTAAIVIGAVGLVFAAGEPVSWNLPVGVAMIIAAGIMYEVKNRKEKKKTTINNNKKQ